MANPAYDPFPEAASSQLVRKEIVGREAVLNAQVKGPAGSLRPGQLLEFKRRKYVVKQVKEQIDPQTDQCVTEVEATFPIAAPNPMGTLQRLRQALSTQRP